MWDGAGAGTPGPHLVARRGLRHLLRFGSWRLGSTTGVRTLGPLTDRDDALAAIRASMAIPVWSGPAVAYRGELLSDGGLIESIPVDDAARRGRHARDRAALARLRPTARAARGRLYGVAEDLVGVAAPGRAAAADPRAPRALRRRGRRARGGDARGGPARGPRRRSSRRRRARRSSGACRSTATGRAAAVRAGARGRRRRARCAAR